MKYEKALTLHVGDIVKIYDIIHLMYYVIEIPNKDNRFSIKMKTLDGEILYDFKQEYDAEVLGAISDHFSVKQ